VNKVSAVVTTIEQKDVVTYIHVASGDASLRLVKSKCPSWLSPGDKVFCTFQEGSVCVSKECPGKVSIENRLPAVIKTVRRSESLCELTFESEMGPVISLITAEAFEELGLEEGGTATMLLRGIDIGLEPDVEPDLERWRTAARTKDAN